MSSAKPILGIDEFEWIARSSYARILDQLARRNLRAKNRLPKLLHYYAKTASEACYKAIVDIHRAELIKHGSLLFSLINTLNEHNETPLVVAVKAGLHPVARQLIRWGSDEHLLPGDRGLLAIAAEQGDLNMMFLLYAQLKRASFRYFHVKRTLKKLIQNDEEETLMASIALLKGRYSIYDSTWRRNFLGAYLCDTAIAAGKWRLLDTFLELKFKPSETGMAALNAQVQRASGEFLMYCMQRHLVSLFNWSLAQVKEPEGIRLAMKIRQARLFKFREKLEARLSELEPDAPTKPPLAPIKKPLPPAPLSFARCVSGELTPVIDTPLPLRTVTPPVA